MADNFVQSGNFVTLIAPEPGVLSGQPFMVGSIFAIAETTQKAGEEVEGALTGVWLLRKAAGSIDQGEAVYWDESNGVVVDTAGPGNIGPIGVATKAAGANAAEVRVRLDGRAIVTAPAG